MILSFTNGKGYTLIDLPAGSRFKLSSIAGGATSNEVYGQQNGELEYPVYRQY